MIKQNLSLTILGLIISFTAPSLHAETSAQDIVNVGGREVLINTNGTWVYKSTDRYANTKDGQRIRLKEDGRWQYVGNAPSVSKQQVRTTELDIELKKVVIETFKKKTNKSSRIKTQTVFYFDLELASLATTVVNINKSDISSIKVRDDTNRIYPVLSISPSPASLQADSRITIVIRVEKSPSFLDDVKSMSISFSAGIFGLKENISFTQKVIDFDEEKVEGFDKP